MGLDMYLYKETYVKRWNHHSDEERYDVTVLRGGKPVSHIQSKRISSIREEIGYWRKANAIHLWFVKNCQGGEDDCRSAYVSSEQLRELLDAVQVVLKSTKLIDGVIQNGSVANEETGFKMEPVFEDGKIVDNADIAKDSLPTGSGFFFGSTDYDEWYVKDLKDTEKIIAEALKDNHSDFYYESSW